MRFLILACVLASCTASPPTTQRADALPLAALAGDWAGTLTYTDYSDDATRVTLTLTVGATSRGADGVRLAITFVEPDGSKLGRTRETLRETDDGLVYEGETWTVLDRRLEGDTFAVTVETELQDNERDATVRHEIVYDGQSLTDRKTVRYQGTDVFFERNTLLITRR